MTGASRTLPPPLILAVVGLGAFVTALDQTVVVTALPSLMLDLKISLTQLDQASWIITAYLLGYTAAMPVIGRLADVYGYAKVYQVALVVFVIGTSLVAVSQSLEWMVAARVIQAVGGGATVPIGLAIAGSALPRKQWGLALGIVAGAAEAGSMLGPAYGGAIIELSNWRWIFWLNVPQSAVLFLALFWLPNQPNCEARVDYLGSALLVAALLLVSLALSRGSLFTLSSPVPFVMGAVGLALAGVLLVVERRAQQPLLSPALFRAKAFLAANGAQLLVGVSLIIAMVTVPLMANTIMGKTPLTGAMWLLRMTGAIPVGAVIGGHLLGRVGIRPVMVAGLGSAALGLLLVSGWDLDVRDPQLTLHLAVAGLGFGLVISPIMTQALTAVSDDYRATAASLVVVARMLGMTLGLAALSAWGVEHFQTLMSGLEFPLPEPGESAEEAQAHLAEYNAELTAAGLSLFHNFLRVAAAGALVAILPALAMGSSRGRYGKSDCRANALGR